MLRAYNARYDDDDDDIYIIYMLHACVRTYVYVCIARAYVRGYVYVYIRTYIYVREHIRI